jgi:hypothetical protein
VIINSAETETAVISRAVDHTRRQCPAVRILLKIARHPDRRFRLMMFMKMIFRFEGKMSYFEVQINSQVAEIRNGEPHIFRFEEHKHKADDLRKLYWAYNNQAHWLVEASKHADSVYHAARLFDKAAYAMRQAVQVKHWEEIRNRKRGEQ